MLQPEERTSEPIVQEASAYREFLDALEIPVLIIDSEYRVRFMNSAARTLWGDLAGDICYRALRKTRSVCPQCPLSLVVENHDVRKARVRLPAAGGEWHDFENIFIFGAGPVGGVSYVAVACTDVEEFERIEREILKERELKEAILNTSNQIIIGTDPHGRITFTNKAVEELTGLSQRELVGSGFEAIVPEDSLKAAEIFKTPGIAAERKPIMMPVVSRSGERKMISWTLTTLRGKSGGVSGAVAFGQDVTESFLSRKELERRARELELVNELLAKCSTAADQDELLRIALDTLLDSLDFKAGAVYAFVPEKNAGRLVTQAGLQKTSAPELVDGSKNLFPASAVYSGEVMLAGAESEMYGEARELMLLESFRSLVAVPVKPKGRPVALLILCHVLPPRILEPRLGVLKAAAQAVELGSENLFLRQKAEQRAREASSLYKVMRTLAHPDTVEEQLKIIAGEVARLFSPDICTIYLYDKSTGMLRRGACIGIPEEEAPEAVPLEASGTASEAAMTLRTIVVEDAERDERIPDFLKRDFGVKSSVIVPLKHKREFLGALFLEERKKRLYTDEEISLIETMAVEASSAIHFSRLNREVRVSEEKYRSLVESSPSPVLVIDGKGEILFANRASEKVWGHERDRIMGRNIFKYLHADSAEARSLLTEIIKSGEGREIRKLKADVGGGIRYFDVGVTVLSREGDSAEVMLILDDVTERELAAEEVARSEERYRTLVERSVEGIVLLDGEGVIQYANPRALEILGYTEEQLVGKSAFAVIHPGDMDRVRDKYLEGWRIGQTVENYRFVALTAAGEVVTLEANSGFLDWVDGRRLTIILFRDVTGRILLEEERERRLKAEETLSEVGKALTEARNVNEAVPHVLAVVGRFMQVERAYYVKVTGDMSEASCMSEWTAEGVEHAISRLQDIRLDRYRWWSETLLAGRRIVAGSIDEIGGEPERETLARRGVKSILAIPVFSGKRLGGFFCFETVSNERKWLDVEVELSSRAGECLSVALERENWIDELRKNEEFRATVTESVKEGLIVARNGIITWVNRRAAQMYGYETEEMVGRTPEFLFETPGHYERFAWALVGALREGRDLTLEEKGRRKDGTAFDALVTATTLGDFLPEQGEILVMVEDITESKRAEKEMEMALDAYSTIFSLAGDALLVHTLTGDIRDANEMASKLTGYDYLELLAMNVRDLVSRKAAGLYEERLREVLRNGVTAFEARIRRKDGTTVPVEATARLTKIWEENVIIASLRDISERVKSLRETEMRLRQLETLNEVMRAAMSIVDLEESSRAVLDVLLNRTGADYGAVVMVSTGGAELLAWGDPRDVFGGQRPEHRELQMIYELAEGTDGVLFLSSASGFPGQAVRQIMGSGAWKELSQMLIIPLKSGDRTIGLMMLGARKDGTFDVEEKSYFGAIGHQVGVALDNIDMYRKLSSEHERLSTLLRSVEHISGKEELRSILQATVEDAAESVGVQASLIALLKEDENRLVLASSTGIDVSALRETVISASEGVGAEALTRKRAITAGWPGSDFPVARDGFLERLGAKSAAAVPLLSGDKKLGVLIVANLREPSVVSPESVLLLEALGRQAAVAIEKARLLDEARKSLEALENANRELMSLDRMKSEFVSTVSHELRAPLAVVGGFAKTLVEHYDAIDPETKRESIELILSKTLALEELVENLLDMSRLEEGRLEVELTTFDIVELCEEVKKDMARVVEMHEVTLSTSDSAILVTADREKTRVCLNNLVNNAVKFSPGGGVVSIEISKSEEEATVSVRDQGIGIPPDETEKIFDKFYQVDRGEARSFPGSGLGLHITKELLDAMGGKIWVESEVGRGSTFTIALPLASCRGSGE